MYNIENLTNAIIVQAVKDYEKAYRKMIKNPEDKDCINDFKKIERFFYSKWYSELTNLNADKILYFIREKSKKAVNRKWQR